MDAVAIDTRPEIAKLEEQKLETEQELERLQLELHHLTEPSADEADVDAYEREKTWALVQRLRQKLQALDRALESAREGTYGICEGCGSRIEPARLEILPETRLCLQCQRDFEQKHKRARR
jgi:RNA polymerase-binding transcription factor DksA